MGELSPDLLTCRSDQLRSASQSAVEFSEMSRLIVVSNRVSPSESRSEGGAAGGLAIALAAALREYSGFWFGWSGETAGAFTGEVKTRFVDDVEVATIDLEEADYQ